MPKKYRKISIYHRSDKVYFTIEVDLFVCFVFFYAIYISMGYQISKRFLLQEIYFVFWKCTAGNIFRKIISGIRTYVHGRVNFFFEICKVKIVQLQSRYSRNFFYFWFNQSFVNIKHIRRRDEFSVAIQASDYFFRIVYMYSK